MGGGGGSGEGRVSGGERSCGVSGKGLECEWKRERGDG